MDPETEYIDWYNPETGKVEKLKNPNYHPSPYEAALAQGGQSAADELLAASQLYYDQYANQNGTPKDPTQANGATNWYDPSSYNWLINKTSQPPAAPAAPAATAAPGAPPPSDKNTSGGNSDRDVGIGGGGGGAGTNYGSLRQFNDPYTSQYESLLGSQLGLYQQQQEAMRQAADAAAARRAATGPAVDRLTAYINKRVGGLQGPAYTGAEGEVLRTQALDPLERDRTAARQRALEQISARGFDPESGIAQDLLRQVDRAFDEQRTSLQGGIAQKQIQEQRSRDQEAQTLLQYLAMLPDAVARGDLDFVSYVQSLIAQPGTQSIGVGGELANLGSQRLNDALATLGLGPTAAGVSGGALGLLNAAQQSRLQQQVLNASIWGNVGSNLF